MLFEYVADYTLNKLFLYQLTATLSTVLIIRVILFLQVRHRRFQLFKYYGIPGPRPNLFEGNLGLYSRRPFTYENLREINDQYGTIYGIFIGDEPIMIINDLEILRKVFITDTSNFAERSRVFISTSFGENSILFAAHNRWKFFRKLMSPAFNSYTVRGQSSTLFIEKTIKLVLEYIEKRLEPNAAGKLTADIDIQELMKSAALHMISDVAIKLPDVQVCEHDQYVKTLDAYLAGADNSIVKWAIRVPLLRTFLSFLARNIDNSTLALVRNKLIAASKDYAKQASSTSSSDTVVSNQQIQFIDTLIRLHHEGTISLDDILGNAYAILFAGYETTSTTLAYIFWVLAKYPEIQDKLRTDLLAYGTESRYLEQVINETMRLYPTVLSFTTRLATEHVKYDNVNIPKGTKVVYQSWIIHRDPKNWPGPMKFNPERFGPGKTHHPCAFAPFGLGERRCLGYQLAMLEMKMVLCDIVIRYKINLKSPTSLELATYSGVLSKPLEKVRIELERVTTG